MKTIKAIQTLLKAAPTEEDLAQLQLDTRISVQKLVQGYYKRQERLILERARFAAMTEFEQKYYAQGVEYVAGVDEAGRGPLAGPLSVAAVILPRDVFISGLNDSKQLSASKRDLLYGEIMDKAVAVVVNLVGPAEIDRLNIYQATKESMARVLKALQPQPEVALLDAMPEELAAIRTEALVHGDARSISIAAASIIAKVTRDRIMQELDQEFPEYGWLQNKGYGSQKHMQAIRDYGATKWHRRSYEPIKSMHLAQEGVSENKLITLKKQ